MIAAKYGASMLWAAAMGVFLQLWINIEIGRWTVATGETPYTAYARCWRGFAWLFIAFNFFGWFFPGWARASGAALKVLATGDPAHPSPNWMWTAITFAAVTAVLFGPKKIYAAVEKLISFLVVIITVGLLVIAFRVGTWEHVKEMIGGVLNVGYKDPDMSFKALFIAMVFAGAGGTANLFYAYYLRDKQIGMGARIGLLLNPFRQREESRSTIGYRFPDTDENKRRFRDWMRYIALD
jgi:Mn2+/Fe2+ NRAMP family transporter